MDKETAFTIIKESYNLQKVLVDTIFRKYIINKKYDYKQEGTLEHQIYQGIFETYHTISNDIQEKIFKQFPDLKKEYELYQEQNQKKSNT